MTSPAILFGFLPFDGHTLNPACEIIRHLEGETMPFPMSLHLLDVDASALPRRVEAALAPFETTPPRVVLGLGLASGISGLRLEQVALNVADFSIPDNAGLTLRDQAIEASGPQAYLSQLPLPAIRDRLLDAGIPASLSQSAGTYLCNFLYYKVCHLLASRGQPLHAAFLHLPLLPEMVAAELRLRRSAFPPPSMSLKTMLHALRLLLSQLRPEVG